MADRTAALINELRRDVQDAAVDFINQLRVEERLPAVVTSALRSKEEQQRLLKAGRTTTLRSKHLEGLAFDLDMYGVNRDAVPPELWNLIGPIGESWGWEWGGRWKSFRDVGHFQWPS